MNSVKDNNAVAFETAEEMLNYINNDKDIYNVETGDYVFRYNENNSVCVYNLSLEEANELKVKSESVRECWSSLLGAGGAIYDANDGSSLSYCKDSYCNGKWVDVTISKLIS